MKDYAAMSDFEINCSVARALGEVFTVPPKGKPNPYLDVTDTTISLLNCDGTRVERRLVKDFCNNPTDAWSIIVGKKLSLINADDKWLCVPEDEPVNGVTVDAVHMIYSGAGIEHANPLRAAMIVFLMMKEGE